MKVLGAIAAVLGLLVMLFVVLFLGGLCSAALEIRRERKAGLVPTRPAWENKRKRKALGGLREQIRVAWASSRARMVSCWCGRGPIQFFPALGANEVSGWGCAAWEVGDPVAVDRHDRAGGYARTPGEVDAPPSTWDSWSAAS